jgi:CheY-like chemotaxis protein
MAMLAHELRNPLAPIRNAVQILTKSGDDRATVAESCEVLDRQLRHMVRLLDDLLDVSRVGRGKITLRKAPVDLAQVVSAAVETSRPLIEAHHHKLMISLPEGPLFVEADPVRLAQVLSNLLNNAAKFTDDGGRIDLIAERVNAEMRLRVRDTGIGIPPDKLAQVFEMFAQVESDSERAQAGLGVGLTLARRLVEMQGGKIEAYSPGPGRGSEFVVTMAALTEPLAGPIREAVENLPTQAARVSRRVLIVDDNEDTAKSLALMLRLEGHEARIAHSGLTAMEEAHAFRPEFMFLDINLPGVNGCEVARRLRLDPDLRGMTIVAVTGYGQQEDRRRTQEAGFDHHFVKPVNPELIYELMSSLPGE